MWGRRSLDSGKMASGGAVKGYHCWEWWGDLDKTQFRQVHMAFCSAKES